MKHGVFLTIKIKLEGRIVSSLETFKLFILPCSPYVTGFAA
jgi:hypothetical protein